MKILRILLSKNRIGQFAVLILTCLWALLSVHCFAHVYGVYAPLVSVSTSYYDCSYYLSSKQFMPSGASFRAVLRRLEKQEGYLGADYLLSLRDIHSAAGEPRFFYLCSAHMAGAFGLHGEAAGAEDAELPAALSRGDRGGNLDFVTPWGERASLRPAVRYAPHRLLPLYMRRFHRASARLIYSGKPSAGQRFAFDLRGWGERWPEDEVIWPTGFTVFFSRPLSAAEEQTLREDLASSVFITPISVLRENTREEFRAELARILPVPLISGGILFFSLLSFTILGLYKARSGYRLLRQLGMRKSRLISALLFPLWIQGAVASALYWGYNRFLAQKRFGSWAELPDALYEPRLVFVFIGLFALLALLVFILLSLVLRYDERRSSIL